MASSQAFATFFVYLILWGHAHRAEQQPQAFLGRSPPTGEKKGTSPPTKDTFKKEFADKVQAFKTNPSIGSGGQILTFWLWLSPDNKKVALRLLQDGMTAMLAGNNMLPNVAVELESGINNWFQKQDDTRYKNCAFSFVEIAKRVRPEMGTAELVKVASTAFVTKEPNKERCLFSDTFSQDLANHKEKAAHAMKFATWVVGLGANSEEPPDQASKGLQASLTQAAALLEVQPAQGADPVPTAIMIVVIVLVSVACQVNAECRRMSMQAEANRAANASNWRNQSGGYNSWDNNASSWRNQRGGHATHTEGGDNWNNTNNSSNNNSGVNNGWKGF